MTHNFLVSTATETVSVSGSEYGTLETSQGDPWRLTTSHSRTAQSEAEGGEGGACRPPGVTGR